jgi:hypothetical protein
MPKPELSIKHWGAAAPCPRLSKAPMRLPDLDVVRVDKLVYLRQGLPVSTVQAPYGREGLTGAYDMLDADAMRRCRGNG